MAELTRKNVEKTINQYELLGPQEFLREYGYGDAKDYWLISTLDRNFEKFPSKAIAGVTLGKHSDSFDGGWSSAQNACSKLHNLGYIIVGQDDKPINEDTISSSDFLLKGDARIIAVAKNYFVDPVRASGQKQLRISGKKLHKILGNSIKIDDVQRVLESAGFENQSNIEFKNKAFSVDTDSLVFNYEFKFQPNTLPSTNLIFYGPPGTGKTYTTIEKAVTFCLGAEAMAQFEQNREKLMQSYQKLCASGQIAFVTFHQSVSYEEFVEGLRPNTDTKKGDSNEFGGFDLLPHAGVFKRICSRAEADELGKNFVLIIDEINRANISKVFGELITLLEVDKRIGAKNEIQATLPYSGDIFGVPKNLHIIGTMNTADRSIALLDTALRRRFRFEELIPDSELIPEIDITENLTLRDYFVKINERIEYHFDREHQIGHAYFIDCENLEDFGMVMRNEVIPLLAEYFFEDRKKIATILEDLPEQNFSKFEGCFLTAHKISLSNAVDEIGSGPRYRWIVNENFNYSELKNGTTIQ